MDTANLHRDEAVLRSQLLTVETYDVDVDLTNAPEADASTFSSITRIRFTSRQEGSTFLDLLAPRVEGVEANGVALAPGEVFDGHRITIPVRAGENEVVVRAQCAYSRTGEGLHRFVDPVDAQTYLYTQYEPADARRVFATFEQPDLKASFAFHVSAPEGWQVRSNTGGVATALGSGVVRWDFAPTRRISTYITAIVAGPYHHVEDAWSRVLPDGGTLEVPLSVLCRASLGVHLDHDEIFAVTKAGLDFFHDAFEYPYPFGKYDQVFVPEYNLGAMENPGCVTFTEDYVFHAAVTEAEHEARANTILHEMAHMWFGDLVTMRWWDDLWLKESFADYMGALALAEATPFADAWTTFANRRKAWAYRQDQLPTTHPIVADIPDLEAAKLNFDGITYAKGASVLKQLVAYVGRDAFFSGARAYFRRHAFGNATLSDFLTDLEGASGRDLHAWSKVWLETAGTSTLSLVLETASDGVITAARVDQVAIDPATGVAVDRSHVIALGSYDLVGGVLTRTQWIELDVHGAQTPVPELVGLIRPALVVVNDDDLTYAKTVLDDVSQRTSRESLASLTATLPRAVVWSSLWNAVRDAALPAHAFIEVVTRHLPAERHASLLATLHAQSQSAITYYALAEERTALTDQVFTTARRTAETVTPGSDAQLAWTRLAIALAGEDQAGYLAGLLDGTAIPAGLTVDTDLRWAAWISLAAAGKADERELDAELAREDTARSRRQRAQGLAARPSEAAKAAAWDAVVERDDQPNAMVSAIAAGFARPAQRTLTQPYVEPYFAAIEQLWNTRTIEIAGRLVVDLYPGAQDLESDRPAAKHTVVRRTDRWLTEHPDVSASLRRLVIEQRDHLVRSLRAQEGERSSR